MNLYLNSQFDIVSMAKERDDVRMHIHIGQLPRYSRAFRIHDNNEFMEPIHIWNDNLRIMKERKKEEDKLYQK